MQNRIVRNQSFNVGALLPGSERHGEAFIYTAHWDHIGTDASAEVGEDAIYNGAVDNASGIAALLELARSFAALPRAPHPRPLREVFRHWVTGSGKMRM